MRHTGCLRIVSGKKGRGDAHHHTLNLGNLYLMCHLFLLVSCVVIVSAFSDSVNPPVHQHQNLENLEAAAVLIL